MTFKICIVSGSRADYGLLKLTMQEISNDPDLTLQIIVTGTHLSP
ncbi:MAG: UDP-N-acetylglucosamine 2-epimerase (hydrolyzing), partial [Pseudomonadota bacterium]